MVRAIWLGAMIWLVTALLVSDAPEARAAEAVEEGRWQLQYAHAGHAMAVESRKGSQPFSDAVILANRNGRRVDLLAQVFFLPDGQRVGPGHSRYRAEVTRALMQIDAALGIAELRTEDRQKLLSLRKIFFAWSQPDPPTLASPPVVRRSR